MKNERAIVILETIGNSFPGLIDGKSIVDVCALVNHLTIVMKEVFPTTNDLKSKKLPAGRIRYAKAT